MSNALQATQRWLEQCVIGLNLCPFARFPYEQDKVRLVVCEPDNEDEVFRFVLEELEYLYQHSETETTVVIVENALADFSQYLDLLGVIESVLPQTGLEGVLQVASFHPDYYFEGVDQDDVSNYTNRSPYPLFHLIREESLEKAVASYDNPEMIPENNMALMRSMGLGKVKLLLAEIKG